MQISIRIILKTLSSHDILGAHKIANANAFSAIYFVIEIEN